MTDTLSLSVGLEVEVTGGADDAAELMEPRGLIYDRERCDYHCRCMACAATFGRGNVFAFQDDCSVDGEFITRPFLLGDAATWDELRQASRCMTDAGAYASPMESTGCHVHVGAEQLHALPVRYRNGERFDGFRQLEAVFFPLQETLVSYAAGSVETVRGYNYPIRNPRECENRDRQQWLNLRGKTGPTVEFRLWNGSVTAWRWRMYAGISAAIVAATLDGARPSRKVRPLLTDALGSHIDSETRELMARQAFHRLRNGWN